MISLTVSPHRMPLRFSQPWSVSYCMACSTCGYGMILGCSILHPRVPLWGINTHLITAGTNMRAWN